MDAPGPLVTPPEPDPFDEACELAERIIERGINDVLALREGGSAKSPSFRGAEYDEAYAQGSKDTARKILRALRNREHINSVDVSLARRGFPDAVEKLVDAWKERQ